MENNNQPHDNEAAPVKNESHRTKIISTLKQNKRKLISGLVLLVVIVGVFLFLFLGRTSPSSSSSTEVPVEENNQATQEPKETIRFIASGDIIPHDALNAAAKQENGSHDYYQFMDNMSPVFEPADIRFCNQAVLGAGEEFGIKGYPVFNSPTSIAADMSKLGCNLINTGTNHTNDISQAAINSSVVAWDDKETLAVAGANRSQAEHDAVKYFTVDGVSFGFVSYTTYSNSADHSSYGLTRYSKELATRQITEADKKADIVVVSIRWGTEYSPNVNANQDAISQDLADLGADIVLGHGPHVLEPVKKLSGTNGNTTYVWYSLGNFLNAQLEPEALFNGLAVMDISKATKQIVNVGYLPIYMHYEWTPEQAAAQDLLARTNFDLYVFDDAADSLGRSQLSTTLEEQKARIKKTLNTYTNIPLLTKRQYLDY